MKFSAEFYRLQVPRWSNAYIDYDTLKQFAKRTMRDEETPEDFAKTLYQETSGLDEFLGKQHALVDLWTETVLSRFIISHPKFEALDFSGVAQLELQDLIDCLVEILDFAAQLDTFCHINNDAIRRLVEKLGAANDGHGWVQGVTDGLLHTRPWNVTGSRIKALHEKVQGALERRADAAELRSLLLEWPSPDPSILQCLSKDVHDSISNDDSASLMGVMASTVSDLADQAMLHSVLQIAIMYRSPRCIQSLLGSITSPQDEHPSGQRDPLHQVIARLARRAEKQPETKGILEGMLQDLTPLQHHMLITKDWRGRLPLHYAAEYGLDEVCLRIVDFVEPTAILEHDISGETPLALAVYSGHGNVVRAFLDLDFSQSMVSADTAASLLSIAVRSGLSDVAKILVKFGKGLKALDKNGRTPLYHACRTGQVDVVDALLAASADVGINDRETSRRWPPLIVACAKGHLEVVKTLLRAGADGGARDWRGWAGLDHAAYRAHMSVVALLQETLGTNCSDKDEADDVQLDSLVISRRKGRLHRTVSSPIDRSLAATHTCVFVNLGTFDLIDDEKFLGIVPSNKNHVHLQGMQSSMLLEVAGSNCAEQPYVMALPCFGDFADAVWRFSTLDPENMMLTFKLFQCLDGVESPQKQLVGSGIALLSALKNWFRPGRQSLRRDCTVPLNSPYGDYAGSLSFTFLVCRPYRHKRPPPPAQKMRLSNRTQIVAHRGLGLNDKNSKRLQIGEHTIQSLESSLKQGADLIEFDVQVTKDDVPVIYHDWHVSETGLDIPVHAMTFRQWMAISEAQSNLTHEAKRGRLPWDERARPSAGARRLSRSQCAYPDHGTSAMYERMKHSFDYTNFNMKGNTRGDFIHDSFTTLRQLFEKFPDVTFNIELKYPMLWECTYWGMEPYWTEMNDYLDRILDMVYELDGNSNDDDDKTPPRRSVFFSCFNPELCILLSTKQPTYPVLFLSSSMVGEESLDSRATSIQQAVRFARKWALPGVVVNADPFVAAPRLVRHVREDLGLYCGSWGGTNDVPEFAKKQAAAGIDMLVVNNVRLISMVIKGDGEAGGGKICG